MSESQQSRTKVNKLERWGTKDNSNYDRMLLWTESIMTESISKIICENPIYFCKEQL